MAGGSNRTTGTRPHDRAQLRDHAANLAVAVKDHRRLTQETTLPGCGRRRCR